ncbi:MAG: hypothetical protein LH613_10695 [Chamaesiphon sp.]|nr:hypothetical protein [Chamaesiphon sp.]
MPRNAHFLKTHTNKADTIVDREPYIYISSVSASFSTQRRRQMSTI